MAGGGANSGGGGADASIGPRALETLGMPLVTQVPPVRQIWCNSDCYFELWHSEKNGAHHFSLIGCHLESVGGTEPFFEPNLVLSEKRPT